MSTITPPGAAGALAAHLSYQAGPDELRGRVIAITGAGDGIGQAVALAAAAHGAELVLIGRSVGKLEAVHARIAALNKAEASIAPLDLERAVARDYDQLADALQRRYGRLDGLLSCAACQSHRGVRAHSGAVAAAAQRTGRLHRVHEQRCRPSRQGLLGR